jgi:aminoglycoside phosphotransferase (APT) family kinase protein
VYHPQFAGDWVPVCNDDPTFHYLTTHLWKQANQPAKWQVSRLSPAVYVYQEKISGWAVVAKFYIEKTGADAERHAAREHQYTQLAWEISFPEDEFRVVQPLGLTNGTLFIEYVSGLTLEDKIAIRRSEPRALKESLEKLGKFLAVLHMGSQQKSGKPDFGHAADYGYKVVDNLSKHGVLQNNPIATNSLGKLIEKWAANQRMWAFELVQIHGDATTTNFIFPSIGNGVAIDWERSKFDDPAADLGRIAAEITHSIDRHGGSFAEAQDFVKILIDAYNKNLPHDWNATDLGERTRFYQAISTLRIARNGWLSRKDRLALGILAFSLLA